MMQQSMMPGMFPSTAQTNGTDSSLQNQFMTMPAMPMMYPPQMMGGQQYPAQGNATGTQF